MPAILYPLAQMTAGMAMLLTFLITGLVLLRLVKMDCEPNERYLFAFGLGAGAWGMLMFILAASSLLYPTVVAGLLVIGVCAAMLSRRTLSPAPVLRVSSLSWIEKGLIGLLFLHIVFNYVLTFPPPSAYVAVWAALIFLTGVTVGSHFLELRHIAVLTIMIVAKY